MPNLSISIMALSAEPLRMHTSDYRQLTKLTREGDYLNIVKKESADKVAKQFFSVMNVYPTEEMPVVREHF